jgi:hypothetical protein
MTKKRHPEFNLSFLAGLYTRGARQAGVHPSYVSRVARGERRSDRISRAIAAELSQFVPTQPNPASTSRKAPADSNIEYRQRLIRRLKANPQLNKLSAMVIDLESWGTPKEAMRVSRVNLQSRIAANAAMIAASIEQFHRMSRKLENSPHVLSLTDGDGVVLYSFGTTGMVHEQGRVPGANWSHDFMGPSAEARAIAAGVPLIIVGMPTGYGGQLPVRMACPIRLGDGQVAGVVVLNMELSPARAEHLIEIARMSRKICAVVENERRKPSRAHIRSQVQPFEEAEIHLARVMSMPQIDPTTRSHLAGMLAELEEKRREFLLRGNVNSGRKSRKGNAKAQGV